MRTCVLPQNPFFVNIEPRFDSFKEKMHKMASKNHLEFNDDVFMDTIIRCMSTFTNENPRDVDVDKYFWVSYKQNLLNHIKRNKFRNKTDITSANDLLDDDIYNNDIDVLAGMTEQAIKDEFGDRVFEAWRLHVCEDLTYKEIARLGYDDINCHNEFREIKRFITGKYLQSHPEYARLAKENHLF